MPYVAAFLIACLLTYLVTPTVIRMARTYGLVDDPSVRYHPAHTHTGIIPRAGGAALAFGVIIPMCLFLGFTKITIGILLSTVLLVIVGLADDKQDINPYIRIGTNTLAALCVVAAGIGIPYITNPLGGVITLDSWKISLQFFGPHTIIVWADIFALLWIIWTINIVGWSAGVDGQMPGFVAISAAVLGFLSFRFTGSGQTQQAAIFAFIVSGSFAGFIPWNFYPQKIMPGYGGKTLAGLLLAVLGILSFGKVGTALLVLGIPTFDALYTLFRRIQTGKSPVFADRGHLHHRLLDLGWGKRRIAVTYWGISLGLGLVALSVTSQQKLFTLLLVAVGFGGFLIWVKFFSQLSKPPDPDNG